MRSNPRLVAIGLAVLTTVLFAAPARAANFGFRTGLYTDPTDGFVGVEGLFRVSHQIYLNPNIEYIFADNQTYMTFNGDFHYDFHTRGSAYLWIGGGLGVIYHNPDGPADSNTDVGANLLAGAGLKGRVIPYVQAKVIIKDNTQFVMAFGVRF
jgi:hypothetical protein